MKFIKSLDELVEKGFKPTGKDEPNFSRNLGYSICDGQIPKSSGWGEPKVFIIENPVLRGATGLLVAKGIKEEPRCAWLEDAIYILHGSEGAIKAYFRWALIGATKKKEPHWFIGAVSDKDKTWKLLTAQNKMPYYHFPLSQRGYERLDSALGYNFPIENFIRADSPITQKARGNVRPTGLIIPENWTELLKDFPVRSLGALIDLYGDLSTAGKHLGFAYVTDRKSRVGNQGLIMPEGYANLKVEPTDIGRKSAFNQN